MKPYWPAIILIVVGILIIIAPWTFAPVCEVSGNYAKLASGASIPMPCGWTARAEIGIGALLVLAGALLCFAKSAETKKMLSVLGIGLGIFAILFPTTITKMCAMAEHPCNSVTKPVLVLLGLIAIIVSAYVVYITREENTS